MANEILPASIGDLVAGEVLAADFLMLLADRDSSLLQHPALFYASAAGGSSNVIRVPHVGLGGKDLLTAHTPGSEVANTALTDGSTDVTVAPYGKVYALDDLAAWMLEGRINTQLFAQDAALSVNQTLISLIANIGDGFTADEGSGDLTWDVLRAAKTALGVGKADGSAGLMAILHPYQWGDLEADTMGLGVAPAVSLAQAINAPLGSYKGRYMGIDVFTSSHVPLDTGNYKGCLLSRGAICVASVAYPTIVGFDAITAGMMRFALDRRESFNETKMVTSALLGVALGLDSAGCTIVSAST